MGANNIIMLKKTCLLLILFSLALLFSTSYAGRALVHTLGKEVDATHHENISENEMFQHEDDIIHERLLRMNTKDYGRYDPAPALAKPPFKLIPN